MVKEFATEHRLTSAIESWPLWQTKLSTQPSMVQKLGGHTNDSYLISGTLTNSTTQKFWVLRLNSQQPDAGIDRLAEMNAMAAACDAGFAPRLIAHSADFMVTEYHEGQLLNLSDTAEIATLIGKIHQLTPDIPTLKLFAHLQNYHQRAPAHQQISSCLKQVLALPKPAIINSVCCHHDLTLDNIIRRADSGELMVIDWEYARLSDPALELAIFCYCNRLDEGQRALLIESYQRNEVDLDQRIQYFEMVYALIDILWWMNRGKFLTDSINRLEEKLNSAS